MKHKTTYSEIEEDRIVIYLFGSRQFEGTVVITTIFTLTQLVL